MEDMKTVYTALYPQEVYMAKNLLDAEGIGSFIKDELTSQVIGYVTAVGGIKLMVAGADAGRAVELLVEGGYIERS